MSDEDRNERTDPHDEGDREGFRLSWNVGTGAALGIALGTVVFAITGDAFWIAVGPAFGVAVAAAFGNIDG